jgi:UDP:flavonoid glycosyltransferase YjiC (YdhE family)
MATATSWPTDGAYDPRHGEEHGGVRKLRIMFTCLAGYGHFHNVVPLAFVARDLGHTVTFSAPAEMRPVVEGAGFDLLPSGPGRLRMRAEMARSFTDEMPADVTDWSTGARLFGDIAPRLRWEGLGEHVDAYRPDVLVHELLELAGPLVARTRGLPTMCQSIGPFHRDTLDLLWRRAAPLYGKVLGPGFGADDLLENYIEICPDALQSREGLRLPGRIPVRTRAYHGIAPAELPAAVASAPAATGVAKVLLTFGTVSNAAIVELRGAALDLAAGGRDVVATLGPRGWFDWSRSSAVRVPASDDSTGTSWGPGVHVLDYVPLDLELPGTSVLVHHGGSATMRAAIEHAVPMLVVPQGAEQYRNGRWVAAQGLGHMLLPAEADRRRVVAAVRALEDDEPIAARCREAQDALAAMPDPAVAWEIAERLAAGS